MEPANIRDVVQRLKRRRLVATERDPADARQILVRLTPAGLDLIRELIPVDLEFTGEDLLAALTPAERKLLCDLLRRLAEG